MARSTVPSGRKYQRAWRLHLQFEEVRKRLHLSPFGLFKTSAEKSGRHIKPDKLQRDFNEYCESLLRIAEKRVVRIPLYVRRLINALLGLPIQQEKLKPRHVRRVARYAGRKACHQLRAAYST